MLGLLEWFCETKLCDCYTAGRMPGVLHVLEEGGNVVRCFVLWILLAYAIIPEMEHSEMSVDEQSWEGKD